MGERKMKKSICLCLVIVFLPLVVSFSVPVATSAQADDLLEQGYKAYNAGDWQTALSAYQKAIKVPGYATEEIWYMLIVSEMYASDYEAVVKDAERFFRLFPHSSYASYVRYHGGKAYFMLGNDVNAVYHLTEFCHEYPNHELYASALFWIAESFFARANAGYNVTESLDAAESLYRRITLGYPFDPKQRDAQSRLETIQWIKQNNAQLDMLKKSNEKFLAAEAAASVPQEPVAQEPVLTEQQQFLTTMIALNAELDTEKQPVLIRRQILADLLARHSSPSALQWTSAQQRDIAGMMTRNGGAGAKKAVSIDADEKLIADLLGRSAELSNRPQRPEAEEIQRFITDVQNADNMLNEKQKQLEGQQRLFVELIASSMGLGSGSNQIVPTSEIASVTQNLSALETQSQQSSDVKAADDDASSEYATLLQKARSLWSYIVEQNQY
jgi:outer membrane protein assembly factor BamD (BamD/ComL family)